jgi:hypothetical protein
MTVRATVDNAAEDTPADHDDGGYVDVSGLVAHCTVNTTVGAVPDTALIAAMTSNPVGSTSSSGDKGPVEPVAVMTEPAGRIVW